MKKIDLHMHSVATVSDSNFAFSIDTLKKYVECREIDCIAITNHNMFDLSQFQDICQQIPSTVLPGIEIDLEGGHLLLISDGDELSDFAHKCSLISTENQTKEDSISVSKLNEIFPDLSKYLLIPHYSKKPIIKEETLSKLGSHITAGEVTSPKKFVYCLKDTDSLVPVLFSDTRMKEGLSTFTTRQTYLDIGETTLAAIKSALRDKNKVFLSKEEGHEFFDALDNGLKLSTGLNILLGERSTGKSFTLDRIYNEYENVKYIEQFSLLEKKQEDDIQKFNDSLTRRQSLFTRDYLKEIQIIVEDMADVNLENNIRSIDKYLGSLIKNAKESEKADAYSKAHLFNESSFDIGSINNLKTLIDSTIKLIENEEYREIIDGHVSLESLKNLALELMNLHINETSINLKKQLLNDLISSIQSELRIHTAATPIEDIDLYHKALDQKKVEKFNEIIDLAKTDKEIFKKEIQGYVVVANRREFTGAQELKNTSARQWRFSDAYENYSKPYCYLKSLEEVQGLEETDYYKYFVKIEYKILNKNGYEVSGGERSEFRLLQKINDAQQFDILLIDEPESSFDNVFLMNKVNKLIKGISKNMPILLVTHNSTVGASIKPDYVLHTSKKIIDDQVIYDVYSGYPSDKELTGLSGDKISNHEALLNCLEAGNSAYTERSEGYEILKD